MPLPWHDGLGFGWPQKGVPFGQVQFLNCPGLQVGFAFFGCTWIHGTKLLSLVGNSGMTGAFFITLVMKLSQIVAGHAPP